MAFNINTFQGNINEWGVAKQSHFDMFITKKHETDSQIADEHFGFRCETAELPGQSLATVNHRVIGPERKIAYGNIYTDMNVAMLCSYNLREKVFFDDWLDWISGVNADNPDETYDVKYFKNYTTDITINQYGQGKDVGKVYSVKLIDAYPITVSPLSLNHDGADLHRLTVTFAYRKWIKDNNWKDNKLEIKSPAPGFGSYAGLFGAAAGVLASQVSPGTAQAIGAATAIPAIMRNVGGFL